MDRISKSRRKFDVPKWHEGVNKYSRILIWSEQGIADEILFGTALNAFAEAFPNPDLETHFKLPEVMAGVFLIYTVGLVFLMKRLLNLFLMTTNFMFR